MLLHFTYYRVPNYDANYGGGVQINELLGPFKVLEGVRVTSEGTKRRTVRSVTKSSSCMTTRHLMLPGRPLHHWLLWA